MRAKLLVTVTVTVTVVAAAVLATVVAAVGAPASACPGAVRGLGMVAVVARGRVEAMDLARCRTRVLARVSVTSPVGRANWPVVHFLGHGRWLVYATTAADGSLRLDSAAGSGDRAPASGVKRRLGTTTGLGAGLGPPAAIPDVNDERER